MTATELAMGQNVPLLLDGEAVDALRVTVEWSLGGSVDFDVRALLVEADVMPRLSAVGVRILLLTDKRVALRPTA